MMTLEQYRDEIQRRLDASKKLRYGFTEYDAARTSGYEDGLEDALELLKESGLLQ